MPRRPAPRRTPQPVPSTGLSPSQHQRVKCAHHPYEYQRHCRQEAAARESQRCVCELPLDIAPEPTILLSPKALGGRRRDPERANEPQQQLYTLLASMLEREHRHAINVCLADGRADHEPGMAMLAALWGHLAPLSAADVLGCLRHLNMSHVGPPAAKGEPIRVPVKLDTAGAHMVPGCPHSELYRTTRPTDATLRRYFATGRWPAAEARKSA